MCDHSSNIHSEVDFHETSCGSGLSGMLEREDSSGAFEGDLLIDDPGGLTGGRGGVAFADCSSPPANISDQLYLFKY